MKDSTILYIAGILTISFLCLKVAHDNSEIMNLKNLDNQEGIIISNLSHRE